MLAVYFMMIRRYLLLGEVIHDAYLKKQEADDDSQVGGTRILAEERFGWRL